jgi:hypothetical protein
LGLTAVRLDRANVQLTPLQGGGLHVRGNGSEKTRDGAAVACETRMRWRHPTALIP